MTQIYKNVNLYGSTPLQTLTSFPAEGRPTPTDTFWWGAMQR